MVESFKEFVVVMGLAVGIATGINYIQNNREIRTPNYVAIIKPHHLILHQEYLRFKDGSEELRYFPLFRGERHCFNSDNDNKIDRIDRKAWWTRDRYVNTIERDKNYTNNKREFDRYDKVFKNFKKKYKNTIERLLR